MGEALLVNFLLFIAYFNELAFATVIFKPFSISLPDLSAKFSIGNNTVVCGALDVADPLDACTPLRNEFGSNKVMVNPKGIEVLAVFISKSAGEFLKDHARGEKGECCIYPPLNGKAWTVFAICFLSLVVVAAFLVTAFIAPRSLSNWRRNLVKSVDAKTVEALPRVVFSSDCSSSTGETCAICLEDYNDGELLKVLPCQHDFHSSCVESWLTKWGTCCPVCKLDMTTKFAFSENKRSSRV